MWFALVWVVVVLNGPSAEKPEKLRIIRSNSRDACLKIVHFCLHGVQLLFRAMSFAQRKECSPYVETVFFILSRQD